MPILSTDAYGTGPLYTITAGDPFAFLTAGTTYVATGTFTYAIAANAATSTLWIAGTAAGNYFGVYFGVSGLITTGRLSVLDGGVITGAWGVGANVSGTFTLDNAGLIEAQTNKAIATLAATTSRITNTGTITSRTIAMELGDQADRVLNTGTIIGDIVLLGGDDSFNTAKGSFTGTVFGGTGNDTFTLSEETDIVEYADEGYDTIFTTADMRLPANVEALVLRGGAREGFGNGENNLLSGSDRANLLFGLGGSDEIAGGGGDDRMYGGDGEDIITDGEGTNVLDGGNGNDRLQIAGGTNTLNGGAGDDIVTVSGSGSVTSFNGSAGTDSISFATATSGMTIDLAAGTLTGGGQDGGRINSYETITATGLADTVNGGSINEDIRGGGGDDVLRGNAGNDVLEGGAGGDTLDGGAGTDLVSYAAEGAVSVNLETLVLGGAAAGDGYVAIEGVRGSAEADTLTGSAAANTLIGGDGADALSGAAGGDVIEGGTGDDTLSGGAQNDRFVFSDAIPGSIAGGWGAHTITDFNAAGDRIDFRGDSRITSLGSLNFAQSGADLVITVGADTITLRNVALAAIDTGDFLFA